MQLGSHDHSLDSLVNTFVLGLKGLLHPVAFDPSFFPLVEPRVEVILASGTDGTMQRLLPLVHQIPTLLIPDRP
jgi:hypothetical protein